MSQEFYVFWDKRLAGLAAESALDGLDWRAKTLRADILPGYPDDILTINFILSGMTRCATGLWPEYTLPYHSRIYRTKIGLPRIIFRAIFRMQKGPCSQFPVQPLISGIPPHPLVLEALAVGPLSKIVPVPA
jgi:hypothetical protein